MKKRIKLLLLFCIIILIGVIYSGWKKDSEYKESYDSKKYKYKIGVVLKSMDSEYTLSLKSGILGAGEDFKTNSVIVYPRSEIDVKAQNIMIKDLLNSDIDAIVICPCDSTNSKDYMDLAKKRGIPVFSIDTDIYDENEIYIGSDNFHIGELAGQYMHEKIGNEGKVAILSGTLIASPHYQRAEGFKEYIKKNSSLEVVYEDEAYCSFLEGVKKTKEIFDKYPHINGIFSTNATMALGIVDRMEFMKIKREIPIIGVDTQSDSIGKVLDGKIAAMVSQNGYDIAYETIKTVVRYLDGEEINKNIYTKSELITKENAKEYLKIIDK
ncbi:ABC transporter substrate-binding protein [Anaeromicrobium sediminis]|uniref:Periplasmic binding protein domain-containing protein n=1 Tax=Anaeromicrobium sediminis TaxID=1478221 RepID=A0A267MCV3_9FIRM|nr:ABC transporter substrate-binding protein [Anaeromicrobium sediminis]PAB56640.1 hypothetical protein CCE28_20625 [Anaeromicrobium sediminis]